MPKFDPTTLEIYRALYTSVAEEMGIALRRTAFSPNIKERRDYSCAVFDAEGNVIAQGDHMPVHLGSMPMAVAAALRAVNLNAGDVAVLNDPFAGGTHLPDVTLVAPVFENDGRIDAERSDAEKRDAETERLGDTERSKSPRHRVSHSPRPLSPRHRVSVSPHPVFPRHRVSLSPRLPFSVSRLSVSARPVSPRPLFYVANRAHHADIGGATPGSMGLSTDVYGEGIRIPPVRLICNGQINEDVMRLILANVRGSGERQADFRAQIGSLFTGATRLREIIARRGARETMLYARNLIEYSARLMRHAISQIPDGRYVGEDVLDDDGFTEEPIPIRVSVTIKGERALVDFTGSSPQVAGSINAVEAITVSAVSYVFRCLLGPDVPASAGLMSPIEVVAPPGTIVNATPPAAVAGGNVETSQRIVDVLFRALASALPQTIPAASQGTMNNLTIGGLDSEGKEFSYYETVAGGMGARPNQDGLSAVHTHMTNSLNTPAEALEYSYPLRVIEYGIRKDSGGAGTFRGGDGVVREVEVMVPARMSLLSDRRKNAPYGLAGGEPGKPGKNVIVHQGKERSISSKGSWDLEAGDRVRIETPGGGGLGKNEK